MSVIYYNNLYRKKGIRKSEHFLTPKILNVSEYVFPIDSVLNWWKVSDREEYIEKEYSYFNNVDRAVVRSIYEYSNNVNLLGKYVNRSFVINNYIKNSVNKYMEFKYLKPNQELAINSKILYINNYGCINGKYKYNTQQLREYYMFYNTFSTVIDNLFKEHVNRKQFIILDMPSYLPSRQELDRYSNKLTNQHLSKLPTYQHLTVLDIWAFLTPSIKHNSILSKIPINRYQDVILLLCLDNKIIMLSLDYLVGMVQEYNYPMKGIQPKKSEVFKKMFYIMLTELINKPAMLESELEELLLKESEENVNTNLASNIMPTSVRVFNKNLQIMNIRHKEDISKDIDEQELNTILKASEDDMYIASVKDEELGDIEVLDSIVDSEDPLSIEDNLLTTTNSKYNSIEDILTEEYKYNNVIKELEYNKDNKLINTSNYKSMLDKYNNHMSTKDPYGSNSTIGDMLDDTKDDYSINNTEIRDNISVLDKKQNKDIVNNMFKDYINNQYNKDMLRVVNSLQNDSFILEEHIVNSKQNVTNDLEEHIITFRSIDNKIHNVKLILPKIKEDGTMYISGQSYRMRLQKNSLPILKIDSKQVKLTSYYGRVFITKAMYKKDDMGYYIFNKISKLYQEGIVNNLVALPSDNKEVKLPKLYSQFSRYMKSFSHNGVNYNFSYLERHTLLDKDVDINKLEGDIFVLIGVTDKKEPILMDMDNRVFKHLGNKAIELDSLLEIFNIDSKNIPTEFATVKVFKKQIPIAVFLCYYIGLTNLLKLLNIRYELVQPDTRVKTKEDTYIIKFKDSKLILYKDNSYGDMILAGLNYISKVLVNININMLNDKNKMYVLFSLLEYTNVYINEINMLENMFMDPITISIAKKHKLPTNFKGLLIKACELLVDDSYTNPQDIHGMTLKGYERIAGMVYNELITGLKQYNIKNNYSRAKLNIYPYSIITKINEDSTTVLIDDLNPMSALKQQEDVSFLGAGGFNKVTMNRDTRELHSSEIGITSEAAKDNGDVGITSYLSANPVVKDTRGNIGNLDIEKDGLPSIYTTNAMLMPFSLTDDSKRLKYVGPVYSNIYMQTP